MKTFLLSLFLFLSLVSVSQTQQEIKSYFNEVAYGSDEMKDSKTNKITKWDKDIKMYLDGYYTNQDLINVKSLISELNTLIGNIKITIVKNKSEANSIVFFGDFNTFNSKYLYNQLQYVNCNGYCLIYSYSGSIIIDNVKIFIRNDVSSLDKKHAIIEEITQSLGLANDSWTYEDSMFYEGYTTTQQLSKIDKEVIKMLYK
jgi:hypothetical protein